MPLWLIILLIAVAVIAIFLIFTYNGLVRSRNLVDEAWNQISVQLKRRHDLIPNLINAVKGYMQSIDCGTGLRCPLRIRPISNRQGRDNVVLVGRLPFFSCLETGLE